MTKVISFVRRTTTPPSVTTLMPRHRTEVSTWISEVSQKYRYPVRKTIRCIPLGKWSQNVLNDRFTSYRGN